MDSIVCSSKDHLYVMKVGILSGMNDLVNACKNVKFSQIKEGTD